MSARTVKNWVTAGHLQAIRLGNRLLVHRTVLASFLETLDHGRQDPDEAPWIGRSDAENAALARFVEAAPAGMLARLEELHARLEGGDRLTRAERFEMVALERAVNAAATDRLEQQITAAQP